METFLLTWNPLKSEDFDPAVIIRQLEARRPRPFGWSCGRSLQVRKGARLFFMKQGAPPRGIIGSAVALSDSRAGESWDGDKAKNGATSTYVNLRWLDMIDPASNRPLDPSQFSGVMAEGHWRPQSSGTRIQPHVAKELERLWSAHVGSAKAAKKFKHVEADYVEGKQSRIYTVHRKRERDPMRDTPRGRRRSGGGSRLRARRQGARRLSALERAAATVPAPEVEAAPSPRWLDPGLVLERKRRLPWRLGLECRGRRCPPGRVAAATPRHSCSATRPRL